MNLLPATGVLIRARVPKNYPDIKVDTFSVIGFDVIEREWKSGEGYYESEAVCIDRQGTTQRVFMESDGDVQIRYLPGDPEFDEIQWAKNDVIRVVRDLMGPHSAAS